MRNVKKWMSLMLTAAMGMSLLAGCGSAEKEQTAGTAAVVEEAEDGTEAAAQETAEAAAEEDDPFLTGEKPVLNILFYNQPYDMNADAAKEIMEELTGYEVVYHNLPSENASEKLMLEIASGTQYDMIYRCKEKDYKNLLNQNALMDCSDLIEKYGDELLKNINELDWGRVTGENGEIYGVPYPGNQQAADTLYGAFSGGIAYRSDILEALGKEIPKTIDEFYDVLTAYKEAYGTAPLSLKATANVDAIASAFGFGNAEWYDVDGELVHRIRLDGFKDYIAFMQKLYAEELLDNDMPINASKNCREKFTNGTALCINMNFWDIPTIKEALELNNPEAKAVFSVALAADENTPGVVTIGNGSSEICVIPKTAENPEHAMIWYNIISNADICKQIYIGTEGVHHEVVDGQYYPIFPAFDELANSDKYTGSVEGSEMKKQWMARARKTEEMAEAFDQMNEDADSYTRIDSYTAYAAGLPALTEYSSALSTAISDIIIAGIVEGGDPQAVVDECIATWEREGGLECEKEINEWYADFNK